MTDNPEWNYDPVRRLLGSMGEAITKLIQWAMFEPNDVPTWRRVRQEVAEYLIGQWRDGALVGTKPTDAFFVRCDQTTMTQDDIDNGRLICLVGVAAVKPAEFVIIRIAQLTADAKP
jgi:uncharacterized protein